MIAIVSQEHIVAALKRGLLPLYTASDLNWPWLKDEAWVQEKSEQEAIWAAYSALPDIARAVLSFDAFAAKASPEQIAAGLRVATQQGQQAAGLVMPSQLACLRLIPNIEQVSWQDGYVGLTISPKFLAAIEQSVILPVQYGPAKPGKHVGWQQMPTYLSAQQEVRWLAPKAVCVSHNGRFWLKLSKTALSQVALLSTDRVYSELAQLLKVDQRYRQVQLQSVKFDIQSFSYQLL